ncbi:MAG: hypothetical protein ACRBBN_00750 [Methyloligellaceae bacterium]
MEDKFREIWETYTSSWKSADNAEKQELYRQSLDDNCTYTDPLTSTQGWDQLLDYMNEFHKQIPGGYFETTYFLTHHNRSIAQWNMKSGDGTILGTGISYGQYNDAGKLTAMVGFYETPEAS